jgi:hypothetical protein
MTLSVLFWILMIMWLVFGFWVGYIPTQSQQPFHRWGGSFLLFVLLAILGYAQFGAAVK